MAYSYGCGYGSTLQADNRHCKLCKQSFQLNGDSVWISLAGIMIPGNNPVYVSDKKKLHWQIYNKKKGMKLKPNCIWPMSVLDVAVEIHKNAEFPLLSSAEVHSYYLALEFGEQRASTLYDGAW